MRTTILYYTAPFFRYSLLLFAILYIVVYIILVCLRIQYPFELEWMEGGAVDHVRRILLGKKLYVDPSLEFIPYTYTPFYFYLSALVAKTTGIGFTPLRLVSLISSLGSFFVIFLIIKRETKNYFPSIIASCFFAATFQISGAWFDIGRVDSLFLFLSLLAIYVIKFHTSRQSYIIAGILISLAFFTKQTALVIALPLMMYCIFLDWRRSIFFIGTAVTIVGISTLFLNHLHGGWYSFYTFDMPRRNPINEYWFFNFWIENLLSPLPISCVMLLFSLFTQFSNSDKRNFLFYFLIAVGMIGGSYAARLYAGGYLNALFPAYAIISLLSGLAIHSAFQLIHAASKVKRKAVEICIYLICIVQFSFLIYNPLDYIPTQEDLEAGREFIKTMKHIKGDVFLPNHGYLPVMAGKSSYAHTVGMWDIWTSNNERAKIMLRYEIYQAIHEKRFGAMILNGNWFKSKRHIRKYYKKPKVVFHDESVFWPITGRRIRPHLIFLPKEQ